MDADHVVRRCTHHNDVRLSLSERANVVDRRGGAGKQHEGKKKTKKKRNSASGTGGLEKIHHSIMSRDKWTYPHHFSSSSSYCLTTPVSGGLATLPIFDDESTRRRRRRPVRKSYV